MVNLIYITAYYSFIHSSTNLFIYLYIYFAFIVISELHFSIPLKITEKLTFNW